MQLSTARKWCRRLSMAPAAAAATVLASTAVLAATTQPASAGVAGTVGVYCGESYLMVGPDGHVRAETLRVLVGGRLHFLYIDIHRPLRPGSTSPAFMDYRGTYSFLAYTTQDHSVAFISPAYSALSKLSSQRCPA